MIPLIYRLFCLQSHYRGTLVFSYMRIWTTWPRPTASWWIRSPRWIPRMPPLDTEAETALREEVQGRAGQRSEHRTGCDLSL